MMNNNALVSFKDVTKTYDTGRQFKALDNVTLAIEEGESIAVMGPSGSGKSTLLNLMAGMDSPTSGEILFEKTNIAELDDNDRTRLRRKKIGMIFQNFNLLPTLTAAENVSLPLRLQGIGEKESNSRAEGMLENVGLSERKTHLPDEMSGGERQRVAIARALIFNPKLLLADEPTGNLDSKSGKRILDQIRKLHEKLGTTIVIVTHDKFAAGYCGRIIRMKDGTVLIDH
jgi:putative ABC transport system ATP-binding protein